MIALVSPWLAAIARNPAPRTCRKCKVRVASGAVPIDTVDPRAFSPDELRDGWRLACRAAAVEDLEIDVPPLQTRPKAALVGVGRHVILRPSVQKRHVALAEPSLEDQASDLERIAAAVDDIALQFHPAVARTVGRTLRQSNFDVTVVVCDELGVNMTCGASNTSFGLPGRHVLGAGFLAIAASHGLTSAIMDARSPVCVEGVRAADFLLGHDEWGGRWIAAHRAKQAAAQA